MVRCPSCAAPSGTGLVCERCGRPLGEEFDCFAALGLEPRLALDGAALETRYHELGRRIHPDRFATDDAEVRAASLKAMALLTRSYRTLRDPISRGLYWLELRGEKLAEDNKTVPPELAEMVFEIQEQLAELGASPTGNDRDRLRGEIEGRRGEVRSRFDRAHRELEGNFVRWDRNAGGQDELTAGLKQALSKIAYLRTLLRDMDRALAAAAEN